MNTDSARKQMVEQQVRTWDVFDPDVLRIFGQVARDRFVPENLKDVAYADAEIPLPHGQCMLRPSIAGRLIQALQIQPTDTVLEIGTGTGYLTACLAKLAQSVFSVDIHDDFIRAAEEKLANENVRNVTLETMDAMVDLPPQKFDVIVVTGSISNYSDRFVDALKPGGRLFVVTGKSPVMTAKLITAGGNGETTVEELFETDIPALGSGEEQPAFSF
jgi:protein-L-isoaspartate(D-aspartate) O-methyltransferase